MFADFFLADILTSMSKVCILWSVIVFDKVVCYLENLLAYLSRGKF